MSGVYNYPMEILNRWRRWGLIVLILWEMFSDSEAFLSAYLGSGTILVLTVCILYSLLGTGRIGGGADLIISCMEAPLVLVIALISGHATVLIFIPLTAIGIGEELQEHDQRWQRIVSVALPLLPISAFLASPFIPRSSGAGGSEFLVAAFSAAAGIWYPRLRMKMELSRSAALRKSLAGKEAILSTLAHEVRTPITVIQSTAEIMKEGRTGELSKTQRDFLDSITSSARRLITFSENILASIKVESDLFAVRMMPVDLRGIIKDVAAHMGPVLEEKQQSLRYTFPKLLSRPEVDAAWIHQVLVNLVHNASKHLSSGGRIIIAVNENEQCIVVSVSDDGSGIKTEERIRVFDEYFQGDEYAESRLEGAGLGLAIVKRVVEKHQGKVYVGSVKGHGTTVSFTLPKKHPGVEYA